MSNQNFLGDLSVDYTRAEQSAFTAFRENWERGHAKPILPAPVRDGHTPFLSIRNWVLLIMLPKTLATLTLSAIRTGTMFLTVALLENPQDQFWAWMQAVSSVFVFEVGIVIYSIYQAKNKRERSKVMAPPLGKIIASLSISVILMVIAGVGRTLAIIAGEADSVLVHSLVNWGLLIFMGAGVPIMALLDGEIIGELFTSWIMANETIEERYGRAYQEYNRQQAEIDDEYEGRMLKAWEGSLQFQQLQLRFKELARSARRIDGPIPRSNAVAPSHPVAEPAVSEVTQVEKAIEFLSQHPDMPSWIHAEHVPSARTIADEMVRAGWGERFSSGSMTVARQRWIDSKLNGHS